jgi:hypothetical protein
MRQRWRSLPTWRRPRLAAALAGLVTVAGLTLAGQGAASAGVPLPDLVSAAPVATTPNIFAGDSSTGVTSGCSTTWFGDNTKEECVSSVYSQAIVNGEVIVGGAFTQVCKPGPTSSGHCTAGTEVTRDDVFAYSLATGAIDPNFAPQLNEGPVFSVAAGPAGTNTVYIGGSFTTVNGTSQRGVAQLSVTPSDSATDGKLVTAFKGHVSTMVDQLALSSNGTSLYVGGQFATADSTKASGLVRVNATTGAVDPSFNFTLSDAENGAALKVEAMALSPDGSHLVIGGTFLDVANSAYDGGAAQSRPRMAVINTGGGLGDTASLTDFTAPILTNNCSAEHDYVRALDFGENGSYVIMGATGYESSGGPTVCDAVSRYNLTAAATASSGTADDVSPAWINYAGGDSFYAVDVAGPVVYVAGHNRWVNNQCGVNSLCSPNAMLVDGVAALDVNTGLGLPWWEPQTSRGHGTQYLGTFPAGEFSGPDGGLMIGTDVNSIGGAFHGETGIFPLTSTAAATPGGPVPSGLFNEDGGTNTGTDMCVNDAGNSSTSGTAVQLSDCTNSPAQNWTVAANGTIQINGLCLGPAGGGTVNNTAIVASTCTGASTQQWAQGTGNTLTNTGAPGMCLDDPKSSTTNNIALDLFTCNGGPNQVWPLPAAQAPPTTAPVDPVFSPVIYGDNEYCMDNSGDSSTPGGKVDIYVCNGTAAQDWTLATNGIIQDNGLCLDAAGTGSGSLVTLATCSSATNEVWTAGSSYSLVNKASGLCLDDPAPSGKQPNGNQLIISGCTGASIQQWRLPAN